MRINGNKAFEIGDEDRAREWYKKACETGRANVKVEIVLCICAFTYRLCRRGGKVLDSDYKSKRACTGKKEFGKATKMYGLL